MDYDNSLLSLGYISPSTCTAGTYPCNDAGYIQDYSTVAYPVTNKVIYGEIYVRRSP